MQTYIHTYTHTRTHTNITNKAHLIGGLREGGLLLEQRENAARLVLNQVQNFLENIKVVASDNEPYAYKSGDLSKKRNSKVCVIVLYRLGFGFANGNVSQLQTSQYPLAYGDEQRRKKDTIRSVCTFV